MVIQDGKYYKMVIQDEKKTIRITMNQKRSET